MTDPHDPDSADPAADRCILDRTIWHVMPLVTLCMAICTVDRSNIGFAKLSMAGSLGMSEATFAFGSSLFYVGYLLFEIPSALAAHRYGVRLWLARIMGTWGLATVLLAFATTAPLFYALRFGLGIAEAGLYPALLYFITLWFPRHQHPRALGFLTIGSALGNGAGALVAGPLLDLQMVGGFQGWQWIFLVTGLMPLIAVGFVLTYLKDGPARAGFLELAERDRLETLIAEDSAPATDERQVLSALGDFRVLGHGVVYATVLTAFFGMIYWSPSLIKSFGVSGAVNGLMVALPWAIDIVLLLVLPRRLTSPASVLRALLVIALLGAGVSAAAVLIDDTWVQYAALLVGIPCISLVLSLYWAFPVRLFRGARSAAAVAAISMIGNVGGLIGQNAMPAVAKLGGSPVTALWVPCVCLGLIGLGALIFARRIGAAR